MKTRAFWLVLVALAFGIACWFLVLGVAMLWQWAGWVVPPIGWLILGLQVLLILVYEIIKAVMGRPSIWTNTRMSPSNRMWFFAVLIALMGGVALIAQQSSDVAGYLLLWLPLGWYVYHSNQNEIKHPKTG